MPGEKIVIIGANGQLGAALREVYPEATALDSNALDITDIEKVNSFNWSDYEVVLNAAAYTAVDPAETPEGRVEAWQVNATAVGNLARAAIANSLTLVHISSDYVFDGSRRIHTEDEAFSPLGVYGQTKAAGDIAAALAPKHYILRTSWVIGNGTNFVRTMQSLAEKGVKPSVVNDQIGRLTFTDDLAGGIRHLLDTNAPHGTYNLSNDGENVSWADIAKVVYDRSGKPADDVAGVTTEEYYRGKNGIAPRPLHSTLSLDKIKGVGFIPRSWEDALEAYITGGDKENL